MNNINQEWSIKLRTSQDFKLEIYKFKEKNNCSVNDALNYFLKVGLLINQQADIIDTLEECLKFLKKGNSK